MGMYIPDTKEILLGSGPKASCDSQDQRLSKDCEDSLLHELMHHILRSNNIKLNNPQFRNEVKSDILSHMINWPKEKVDRAANVVLGVKTTT